MESSVTTGMARIHARELGRQIRKMLEEFTSETGLVIYHIDIRHKSIRLSASEGGAVVDHIYSVDLEVKMDI